MENGYAPERQGCDHYRRRPRHGRCQAQLFAAEGAKVVVAAILASDADVVAAVIRTCGGEAFAAKIDVANEAEWVGLIGKTLAAYWAGAACAGRAAVWMRRRQPAAPNDHRLTLVVMPIPPRLGAHHMF